MDREEAVLDLEVRSADVPRLYLDVTVRHAVGADAARQALARAARHDGTTAAEGEGDKRARYPQERSPYGALPLALETYGRHGREALRYLRRGQMIDPGREPIRRTIDSLGQRRLPIVPFLPRRHLVNRALGTARSKFVGTFSRA